MKKQHGGKRPGAGRPKKADAKTAVFSVAVTADELQRLKDSNAKDWARDVLLRSLRRRTND